MLTGAQWWFRRNCFLERQTPGLLRTDLTGQRLKLHLEGHEGYNSLSFEAKNKMSVALMCSRRILKQVITSWMCFRKSTATAGSERKVCVGPAPAHPSQKAELHRELKEISHLYELTSNGQPD